MSVVSAHMWQRLTEGALTICVVPTYVLGVVVGVVSVHMWWELIYITVCMHTSVYGVCISVWLELVCICIFLPLHMWVPLTVIPAIYMAFFVCAYPCV